MWARVGAGLFTATCARCGVDVGAEAARALGCGRDFSVKPSALEDDVHLTRKNTASPCAVSQTSYHSTSASVSAAETWYACPETRWPLGGGACLPSVSWVTLAPSLKLPSAGSAPASVQAPRRASPCRLGTHEAGGIGRHLLLRPRCVPPRPCPTRGQKAQ